MSKLKVLVMLLRSNQLKWFVISENSKNDVAELMYNC